MPKALVVEDEDSIRWILAAELEEKGYLVQEASSGAIALQRVGEQIPDVIFVDILMPFMDGFELISSLRDNPETSDVPVVLVTGLDPHETKGKPRQLGVKYHLTKPWEPWALDSVLRKIFNPG